MPARTNVLRDFLYLIPKYQEENFNEILDGNFNNSKFDRIILTLLCLVVNVRELTEFRG